MRGMFSHDKRERNMKRYKTWAAAAGLTALMVLGGCSSLHGQSEKAVEVADNSRSSLDWQGTYYGVLPCADCAGIATTVTLHEDGSYNSKQRYLGKTDTVLRTDGAFSWDGKGASVTLQGDDAARYQVGENQLIRLKTDGTRVEGALAPFYVLKRAPLPLVDTRWELLELDGVSDVSAAPTPYVVFEEDGRVNGFDACNNLMGSYSQDKATAALQLESLASTRRFCEGQMQLGDALGKALASTKSYSIDGGELMLQSADGLVLARFIAVPETHDAP